MKRIPAAAMLCLLAVLAGCSKVPAGNVGVIVNLYGSEKGVETREVGTGRYWVGVN
nr:prohibitin family protein [Pseudomonas aeruginosa]